MKIIAGGAGSGKTKKLRIEKEEEPG